MMHYVQDMLIQSMQKREGLTLIHLAARSGHVEATRTLIELGADISVRDKSGETVMDKAAFWGHIGVIKVLKEASE